jgi:L-amino acid N-acyltransferase YncA
VSARVRSATPDDAAACAAIYAPYVLGTAITFEEQPPDEPEMARRIAASLARHDWLVIEDDDGRVFGFAYGTEHRARPAYRWSCDVSIYLEEGTRRTGAGRALYEELFSRLATRGYLTAVAGMTLPNEPSEGLHRAMGFEPIGIYRAIGYKLGAWHDVAWTQRPLDPGAGAGPPAEPS